MNRREFIKRMAGFSLASIGLSGGTLFYSREIEPTRLHIAKEDIHSDKLAADLDQTKIIQFSDTHLGFHYTVDDLKHLATEINQRNPDLIVFTGDLVDNPKNLQPNEGQLIVETLRTLDAPLGKYWIYGNHDHGGYGTDTIYELMTDSEFILLKNSHVQITKQQASFNLVGLDDVLLGKPDLQTALEGAPEERFTILLAHEPDIADDIVNYPIDVQLSGHSHGGQIRLPVLGHLYTPLLAEKYVLGKYMIDNRLQLFVNAGIGTTRVPYRLFCRPEIHEFTLKTKLS